MIEQRLLRTDLDGVTAALARRGSPSLLDDVAEAARLDGRLLAITSERDAIRQRINAVSKEVGQLRRDGDVAGVEEPVGIERLLARRRRRATRNATGRSRG